MRAQRQCVLACCSPRNLLLAPVTAKACYTVVYAEQACTMSMLVPAGMIV